MSSNKIWPVSVDSPTFVEPGRLYSIAGFISDSGISYDRILQARKVGIELKTVDCGKRKFVRGVDGIAFIEVLAAHHAATKQQK